MKKKKFGAIWIFALALTGNVALAQQETPLPTTDPFYLELNALSIAFTDSTNNDTLKFTQNDLTDPVDFWGHEILSTIKVNSLITDYELMTDNGTNNIIYEQSEAFSSDGKEYEKRFSYTVKRKDFSNVLIDNILYQDLFCLHILEKVNIYDPELLFEIGNNYYVLYDGNTAVATIAYNETVSDFIQLNHKYIVISGQGSKRELTEEKYAALNNNSGEYLLLSPNPAKNNVELSIMLKHDDEAKITITDITGRTIKQLNTGLIKKQIKYSVTQDISVLIPGVYNVSMITPHTTKTLKLIISK